MTDRPSHTKRHDTDRFLDHHPARPANSAASAASGTLGEALTAGLPDDLGCFGWLRGVKERAVVIEPHRRTGDTNTVFVDQIKLR